jgi:hypothetical protein
VLFKKQNFLFEWKRVILIDAALRQWKICFRTKITERGQTEEEGSYRSIFRKKHLSSDQRRFCLAEDLGPFFSKTPKLSKVVSFTNGFSVSLSFYLSSISVMDSKGLKIEGPCFNLTQRFRKSEELDQYG